MVIFAGPDLDCTRVYKSVDLEFKGKVGQQLQHNKASAQFAQGIRETRQTHTVACLISPSALAPSPG